MKPPPFDYVAPDSLDEALAVLGEHGWDAKILAGGQSLVPLLNFRLAQPALLVDLNRVAELDHVDERDGNLVLGAMTRLSTVERHPRVPALSPLLAAAVPWIAHSQIRNRGTVGGSLAHADPAAELPALALALGGRFTIQSQAGTRQVEAKDFYLGLMATDLTPEEILTEVELPALPQRSGWAFEEFARRHGDYALVGLAAVVELNAEGAASAVRLAYLSAGEVPMPAPEAARIAVEGNLSDAAIAEAAAVAAERELEPTGDIHASEAYKRHLATVLTRKALTRAREMARRAAGGGNGGGNGGNDGEKDGASDGTSGGRPGGRGGAV